MTIATTKTPVLIDHLRGTDSLTRDIAIAIGGSVLLAASAQVAIPMIPVPITLQSLAVLVIGMSFGSRLAAMTVLAYLIEGGAGLPVFAGGSGGASKFVGPTGGYLVGFLVAASLMGMLAERGWDRRLWTTLAAQTIGTLVILGLGVAWLATLVGMKAAVATGFTPFVVGSVLKIGIATALLPAIWHFVRKSDRA